MGFTPNGPSLPEDCTKYPSLLSMPGWHSLLCVKTSILIKSAKFIAQIFWVLYVAGMLLLRRQFKEEGRTRMVNKEDNIALRDSGSGGERGA